jgi:outer membrane protein OmpA-like peptidoglycan-associated protein
VENRSGINIWLAYADLFAGMLIVFAAFYGIQFTELAKERALNEDLQKAQNKAVTLLDQVASRINKRYNDPNKKVTSDGTQLTLPADITFKSRDYSIREESKPWLIEIATELQKAVDELGEDSRSITIEIRGHTDAYRLGGSECMPTNWELSGRRATEIVRLFQSHSLLDPTKFRVVAVGAGEYEEYEKNFVRGNLKSSADLEPLRKIQIRIVPNYEDLLRSITANSKTK